MGDEIISLYSGPPSTWACLPASQAMWAGVLVCVRVSVPGHGIQEPILSSYTAYCKAYLMVTVTVSSLSPTNLSITALFKVSKWHSITPRLLVGLKL
jgi:hypothetical protein